MLTLKNKIKPNLVTYKTCLVTYFDILGFRALLAKAAAGHISRILRVLKEAARRDKETDTDFERLYENFSDLTVRSIVVSSIDCLRLRPSLLSYELKSVAKVQIELMQRERILIRGGMAIGPLVKSWGLVYGSSLVKAYELETKARNPRVIIDPTLVDLLNGKDQSAKWFGMSTLLASDDKHSYVNYLRYCWVHFKDSEDDLLEFLALHKRVIEDGLSEFSSEAHIRSKYRWLRRYHNHTLRMMQVPRDGLKDCLIT